MTQTTNSDGVIHLCPKEFFTAEYYPDDPSWIEMGGQRVSQLSLMARMMLDGTYYGSQQ